MPPPTHAYARIERGEHHVGYDVADDQRCGKDQHESRRHIDVAYPHGAHDRRTDGRQSENDGSLDLPGQHVRKHDALIHDQRMKGIRHRMAHDDRALAQSLGPRRLDILRIQRIEEIAAHHPHVVSEPAEGGDRDDRPDMLHQVDEFVPGPGRPAVARRMEAVDLAHIEMEDENIDDDQRHEEARHRHSEERYGRKQAVDPGILPRRRDDTEGDADHGCKNVADQRQCQRARQTLADDVGDRLVVIEAVAEIPARHDARYPVDVLDRQRPIETVLLAVRLRLGVGFLERSASLIDELRADVVAIVSGRCLDDAEGHHAQDEEHRNGRGDADEQKSEHAVSFCLRVPRDDACTGSRRPEGLAPLPPPFTEPAGAVQFQLIGPLSPGLPGSCSG